MSLNQVLGFTRSAFSMRKNPVQRYAYRMGNDVVSLICEKCQQSQPMQVVKTDGKVSLLGSPCKNCGSRDLKLSCTKYVPKLNEAA